MMGVLFVLFSVLAALAGFLFLSEATTGVGIIGLACYLGILARIAQADAHHKKLMEAVKDSQQVRAYPPERPPQTGSNPREQGA